MNEGKKVGSLLIVSRVIEAQATGCEGRLLFQLVQDLIKQHGVQMTDAIVEPGEAGKLTPIVEDHSSLPVDLESSCVLGSLYPVTRVLPDDNDRKKRGKIVRYAFTDWAMPPDN